MSFKKYIKPHLVFFIFGPILMLTEVLGEVVLPYLMALSLKHGVNWEENGAFELFGKSWQGYSFVFLIGGIMVLFALIMMAGGVGGGYCATRAATGFVADLRKDLFGKVQKFSFANLDTFSTGSLVTRLTNDVTQMQNVIRMALVMLLRSPGMLIGAIIMAAKMNPSLATVILVVLPVLVIVIAVMMKLAFPRFDKMQKKIDAVNSGIRENLTNVRVIKSLVRGDFEEKKFAKANGELRDASLNAFNVMIFAMPIMTLAMNVTTIAVIWMAGKQILVGEMAVEDLTAFTTYIVQILMSLMMLAMILIMGSRAIASASRIKEVLNTTPDLDDTDVSCPNTNVTQGRVEFKDVSFRYYKNSEEKVLNHINLTAEPGETIGVIGSTGSGKSTLLQMIPRLYDVDEGEVLVDGVNVKDYKLRNLRNGVSMVLQNNVLFSGTIVENLKWGDHEASDAEVVEAATAAQAHMFIDSFTEKYETELGQGGVNVSGGQKQRLCIARALLKKPKILILDDSTSAVDTATEARIRECFATTLEHTTKFIIAQRISSVMDADKIVVMDEGEITGIGTHAELLESCETYKEIYYSQIGKEVGA